MNRSAIPALMFLAAVRLAAQVVCFGDSTTAPRAGVVTFCERIGGINRGVPGDTTDKARQRFARDVLAAAPRVVILQFGINDSTVDVWQSPPAKRPRIPLERFAANLRWFAEELRRVGAQPIFLTFNPLCWTPKLRGMYGRPPYQADTENGFEAGRAEYRDAVRRVARETGSELVDVDTAYREWAKAPARSLIDLMPDGMHPNSRGHELTAGLLAPVLRKLSSARH